MDDQRNATESKATEEVEYKPEYIGTFDWYMDLYNRCAVSPDQKTQERLKYSITRILTQRAKYESCARKVGTIPWWLVAAIHGLESSFNWVTYLHNGDPLYNDSGVPQKTVHVPKERGPFSTWEKAAVDALQMHGAHKILRWPIEQCLSWSEKYNGLGYLKHHLNVPSPYLWAGTNLYSRGKYVADGEWDPNAASKQVGVATIAKALENAKIIQIEHFVKV